MDKNMQTLWESLHKQNRFRPKYPAEIIVQFIFRNFNREQRNKVLDLGCGAGRHMYFMASENIDAYGIDISKDGVEYAKKILQNNGLNANLKVASMDKIPYNNEYFDGLISYGVLYYCKTKDIQNCVKEIYRVLKPGGKAVIVVRSTKDYRYGNGKKIENNTFIINETSSNKCAFNENGMQMHFFDLDETKELFKEFSKVFIDEIIETHENMQYCDANFVISLVK